MENNKNKFENLCKLMKKNLEKKNEKMTISNRLMFLPYHIVISPCLGSLPGDHEGPRTSRQLYNGYMIAKSHLEPSHCGDTVVESQSGPKGQGCPGPGGPTV